MIQYHVYPGGKKRIVTFSYDDGPESDERLVALFNKYNVKGTFHLNGARYINYTAEEKEKVRKLYKGHEISCHTLNHGWPDRMPKQSLALEIIRDREMIESIAKAPVVGMSYPNGGFNEDVIEVMESCGIVYSRTTIDNFKFSLPENFLAWSPTCHQSDALALCDKYLADIDCEWTRPLFYIWGHSHEFHEEKDWEYIESVIKKLAGNDKIWYATNIEIYDYLNAQKQLKISVDEKMFTNPTGIDVWVEKDRTQIIKIPAGETVLL